LTEEVFGAPLTPRQVVERICTDVAIRGLAAVLEYGRKLDGADLTAATIRVSAAEIAAAHAAADPEYLATLRRIRANLDYFQKGILHSEKRLGAPGNDLRVIYRPLRRVGVCVPGGAAAYPSTLLMTVVPAQAAGVKEIAVVAPPTPFGADNPDLLAACHELGVTEVYRVGGAQGVAMLACGVDGVPAVDKIVGPGSLFVALAKQAMAGRVGIDMFSGPSEVLVLADESADPEFAAADLIAQAEHSPGSAILVTWAAGLADKVAAAVARQLETLERGELARDSLEAYGALVTVADEAAGCKLANEFAAEHLQIATVDPEATLAKIDAAGTVFLGAYTPVPVGD
ncbi:MAG: histidinol dehydrogenase, partial [Planctomycetia bacterium]